MKHEPSPEFLELMDALSQAGESALRQGDSDEVKRLLNLQTELVRNRRENEERRLQENAQGS